MKKRFSEEQIIGFLREAEAGMPIKDLCRQHGFSEASYYLWRSKFGGIDASMVSPLKELQDENRRLKKMYADAQLSAELLKEPPPLAPDSLLLYPLRASPLTLQLIRCRIPFCGNLSDRPIDTSLSSMIPCTEESFGTVG